MYHLLSHSRLRQVTRGGDRLWRGIVVHGEDILASIMQALSRVCRRVTCRGPHPYLGLLAGQGLDLPGYLGLVLGRDVHCLAVERCGRHGIWRYQGQALETDAHLSLKRLGCIVVNDGCDLSLVADHEKAGQHWPHQQVERAQNVRFGATYLCVGGDAARLHSPRCEVVGQGHRYLSLALFVSAHHRVPEGCVGELGADQSVSFSPTPSLGFGFEFAVEPFHRHYQGHAGPDPQAPAAPKLLE